MLTTQHKFSMLSEETQKEALELYHNMVKDGYARPDEYERIVNYYYELETAVPPDWFIYWE